MSCDPFHELISADLDGEVDEHERADLHAHLASCADCVAFAASAAALHRASRVTAAAPVPDLTDAILGRAAADPSIQLRPTERRPPRRSRVAVLAFQYGLLVVALAMAVLALPELFASSGAAVHTSRHLGGWDVAFAVGLLIAALQPWRARGLLPMAAALAGVMVVTAAVDVARGTTAGLAEGTHVLEVLGLVFLWLLARSTPGRRSDGHQPRRTAWPEVTAAVRGLRSVGGGSHPARGVTATAPAAPTADRRAA
jgi:predicted anti-sigma-YlaC factor YlaD